MSDHPSSPSRRGFFLGAATVGAAAAGAAVLPSATPGAAAPAAQLKKPTKGGGYSLSPHVRRYYETTRV